MARPKRPRGRATGIGFRVFRAQNTQNCKFFIFSVTYETRQVKKSSSRENEKVPSQPCSPFNCIQSANESHRIGYERRSRSEGKFRHAVASRSTSVILEVRQAATSIHLPSRCRPVLCTVLAETRSRRAGAADPKMHKNALRRSYAALRTRPAKTRAEAQRRWRPEPTVDGGNRKSPRAKVQADAATASTRARR